MSETPDGYRLLAKLRGLERQLRRLRNDWRSFRNEPSHETLSDLRLRTQRFAESLDSLASDVDPRKAPDRMEEWEAADRSARRERPTPREVVSASRDLDAKVWEAVRRWKAVVDGNEENELDRLVSVLQGSVHRANTLIVALGGTRPRRSATHAVGETVTPAVTIEGLAAELEGMLWRLQADWQQLRRAPNLDRLRVLMQSFEMAASVAARLRERREGIGESKFQRALRVGRHLSDGVSFLPYRDPFTGIYNREGFDALAGAELKRCRRYGRDFGLLVLVISPPDLEGLQRAVATARAELREYDLVARYVDDLILIGVPEGGAGATRRVASRVLKALRAGNMSGWFQRLSYATVPEDGATLSGLIRAARDRLQE